MKFKVSKPEASNESFIAGALTVIFLPYIIAIVAMTVGGLCTAIARWRDSKRSPEERLARILDKMSKKKEWIWVPDEFPSMWGLSVEEQRHQWGYNIAPDPRKSNPRLTVDNVVSLQTYMSMITKYKTFVNAIARITDTDGCEKVVDKQFKSLFKDGVDVEFAGNMFNKFLFKTGVAKWPTDPFYANVGKATLQIEMEINSLRKSYEQLRDRVKEIIAESTEGVDKPELIGRVAYIRTCEMIATMHERLVRHIEQNLDDMCNVDVIPIWDDDEY
jgi:hypothetical protein